MKQTRHSIDIIIPVFNGERTIGSVTARLLSLPIPEQWLVKIIVVNDGSTDLTAAKVMNIDSSRIHLMNLQQNQGRATARYLGAKTSKAYFLLFLDADCQPDHDNYLQEAITKIERGADLVFGPIGSTGSNLWARYLADVEKKWALKAESRQWIHAITSANLLVARQLYTIAGGFNPEYKYYGFEDRDLVARLLTKTNPRISYAPGMRVHHYADNTINKYSTKMQNAARYSAPLFIRDHLEHYLSMPYSRLDSATNNSRWLFVLGKMSGILRKPAIGLASMAMDKQLLPYPLAKKIVQAVTALSYIYGTNQRVK